MNRAVLQQLAEDRVLDAKALLDAGRWSGAYYLTGYAVECGLKACVLARIERTGIIFEEKEFIKKCWTHDVDTLVDAADLQKERGQSVSTNPTLGEHWLLVGDWNETDRYKSKTEAKARRLYEAVTDRVNGVLPWIRIRW